MKKVLKLLLANLCLIFISNSCSTGIPKGSSAVKNFDSKQYLGEWFEIARLDHRFERNMSNATANYSLNKDKGTINVINRGYNQKENKWKKVEGEAKFVNTPQEGRLKVSFFKPFWGAYNIIDLVDYKYALVVGSNTNYMWILSRERSIPNEIKYRFLAKAKGVGFETEKLIWVKHDKK